MKKIVLIFLILFTIKEVNGKYFNAIQTELNFGGNSILDYCCFRPSTIAGTKIQINFLNYFAINYAYTFQFFTYSRYVNFNSHNIGLSLYPFNWYNQPYIYAGIEKFKFSESFFDPSGYWSLFWGWGLDIYFPHNIYLNFTFRNSKLNINNSEYYIFDFYGGIGYKFNFKRKISQKKSIEKRLERIEKKIDKVLEKLDEK